MTDINKKIITALSAAHDFNKAANVFGGAGPLHQVLRGIAWLDNKNGPVKTDIFRAFSDDDPLHTARRFNTLMNKWDSGTRPSLPAATDGWLDQFGLRHNADAYQQQLNDVAIALAARAEMIRGAPATAEAAQKDEPAYHSRIHFMHVLQATGHIVEQNDHMDDSGDSKAVKLDSNDKTLLLIAALAHDIDHPGRANSKDPHTGKPVLYENEDLSFAIADELFEAYGLSQADRDRVHILLRTTDPNGPHKFLKDAMKAHDSGKTPINLTDVVPGKEDRYSDLAPLLSDRRLCYMAAILSDADLYVSAGAGLEASLRNSEKLNRELAASGISMDFTTAGSRDFFLKNIVGESGFASAAGRKAFNAVFNDLMNLTAQELAGGAEKNPATPGGKNNGQFRK